MTVVMNILVEYLPRIGTVTIVLDSISKPSVATLSKSNLKLENVSGSTLDILLPHDVDTNSPCDFKLCAENCYSLRLKSGNDGADKVNELNKSENYLMSLPEGKWDKKELLGLKPFELLCLNCGALIIDTNNCTKLNEMPSEFWTELMDYWHCHKPIDENGKGKTNIYSQKQNSLNPDPKEVLVGGSFFLANRQTFEGRVACKADLLNCINCCYNLGNRDKDQLFKIYKYNLKLTYDECKRIDMFPPEGDVVLTILNHVKANSTRHMTLRSGNKKVLIWIFSIGIHVTLSDGDVMNDCMKILYQEDTSAEPHCNQNIDDVVLQEIPMKQFLLTLQHTNEQLPSFSATMGLWKISYIPMVAK